MNTSPSITVIATALLKAQKSMGAAVKDSKNPFFKSNYADLNSVLAACKDVLNENGIIVLQPHVTTADGDFVETVLLHSTGEVVCSLTRIEVSKEHDPQAYGSAITYARRYGLQSLLGMGAEDDDAEGAMNRNKPTQTGYAKASAATQVKATVTTLATPINNSTTTNGKANSDSGSPSNVTNITTPVKTPDAVLTAPPKAKTSFRTQKPAVAKVEVAETVVTEDII